jgi:squalene synthase HpnC
MLIKPNELNYFCKLKCEKYDVNTLDDAYLFVKKIAKGHYENFPISSIFVPKKLSKFIFAIYAFARIADDIADEISMTNPAEALILLNQYENCLFHCLNTNEITNPIFLTLKDTIIKNNLPMDLFKCLLTAFRRDINFKRAENLEDLFNYCNYSANPVGELILRIFREDNNETIFYSNKVCTALQFINFLQDLSIDLNRGRNYFPKELSEINEKSLNKYITIIQNLLTEGKNIIKLIHNFRLRNELRLIIFGGQMMLNKIKKNGMKLLLNRPINNL